jgi:hypothetical protein
VLTDSLHPFRFGNALEDGLEECWRRIVSDWRDPEMSRWARSFRRSRDLADGSLVPYLSDEVDVGERAEAPSHASDAVPERAQPRDDSGDPAENLARAREHVRRVALGRRYRMAPAKLGGGPEEHYVRQPESGRVVRLNASAMAMLHELDEGSGAEAVERLAERWAGVERARLEADVLATGRSLLREGVLQPAGAPVTA